MPDDDFARFVRRMPFIVEDIGQCVVKHGPGFLKIDSMFIEVCALFLFIPFNCTRIINLDGFLSVSLFSAANVRQRDAGPFYASSLSEG